MTAETVSRPRCVDCGELAHVRSAWDGKPRCYDHHFARCDAPDYAGRPIPAVVCGPTAGCGRAVPMVRPDGLGGAWTPPERCPHCGTWLGSATAIRAEVASCRPSSEAAP